ncbi:MAG: FixH family protein [Bacteroidales bacterium]|nr:FixH family protein [Bacteroidales bacterium]
MSFKFNWGTGIFAFIALFLISMVVLVYFSMQQGIDLVETEYYPQGLEYQKQIERIANAGKLSSPISVEQVQDFLIFRYPEEMKDKKIKGTVFMYRPSDQFADFTDSLKFDSTLVQRIPVAALTSGRYIAKINWTMDGKEFYHEQGIRINK